MSLIGDSKEEDREIFAALKADQRHRREKRAIEAQLLQERVIQLVDGGTFRIDPNGTWNWKLKGRAGQYWPTKGRWQYTSAKLIQQAKKNAWRNKHPKEVRFYTSQTLFGGGILKFIHWLEREQ